jgi:hypothetical protein
MSGLQNSDIGEWPRTPWENFIQLIVTIIQFVIDVLVAIGAFFVALFEWIIDIGMNMVKAVTQLVLAAVEAILKAIVLVFVYIMFALSLFSIVLFYASVLVTFGVLALRLGAELIVTLNSVKLKKDTRFTMFQYTLGLEKWDLMDLYIPTIYLSFQTESALYIIPFNFITPFALPTLETTPIDNPDGSSSQIQTSVTEDLSSSNPNTASEPIDPNKEFWDGFFFAIDIVSIFSIILGGMSLGFTGENKLTQKIAAVITIIAFVLTFILLVTEKLLTGGMTVYYYIGLWVGPIIGFLVTLGIASLVNALAGDPPDSVEKIFLIAGILATIVSILTSIFTLIENAYGKEILWDGDDPEQVTGLITACTGIIIGGILIGIDDDTWDNILVEGCAIALTYYILAALPRFLGVPLRV